MAQSYFELFDLALDFSLDVDQLTQRYRDLQRATHPDRHANAGERERLLSVQKASLVNDAYRILKSPLLRAIYLLELNGVDVGSQNNAAMNSEFLLEQMELRDKLEAVSASEQPLTALSDLLDRIARRCKELYAQLTGVFSSAEANYNLAAEIVRKLQFYNKLQSDAEAIEEKLMDQ